MNITAMSIRPLLTLLALAALPAHADRILDTRDGRTLEPAQLAAEIGEKDYILLGEQHDNARHHAARAELLALLAARSPVIVAEHLEYGKTFESQGDLEADLQRAGFNSKGWRWPLHQPLFQGIADLKLPLLGCNLSAADAKRVLREGATALPETLATRIAHHPLSSQGEQALTADLERGHCGHITAERLPGMRLAQRGRDAAMFVTLRNAPKRPAVLLAGNGHVRRDYGVPTLIDEGSTVSVGFIEEPVANAADYRQYDYVWITDRPQRDDMCAQMAQNRPSTAK
jgi:uncharacterized iron-regulated protein